MYGVTSKPRRTSSVSFARTDARLLRAPNCAIACTRAGGRCRAQKNEGNFWLGFALGGAVFGAAGFFFAPQISQAILDEQRRFRPPKWLEDTYKKDQTPTKEELEAKILDLHDAITEIADAHGAKVTPAPTHPLADWDGDRRSKEEKDLDAETAGA